VFIKYARRISSISCQTPNLDWKERQTDRQTDREKEQKEGKQVINKSREEDIKTKNK
jgi:hypothetical protein